MHRKWQNTIYSNLAAENGARRANYSLFWTPTSASGGNAPVAPGPHQGVFPSLVAQPLTPNIGLCCRAGHTASLTHPSFICWRRHRADVPSAARSLVTSRDEILFSTIMDLSLTHRRSYSKQ